MNICLIGDNITSLTLAKNLVNKNIKVVVYHNRKNNFQYQSRIIGISKNNLDFFNNKILKIKKKQIWKINGIDVFYNKIDSDKIFNFNNFGDTIFSTVKHADLYKNLNENLKEKILDKNYINFEIVENDSEINIFFDDKTFNLIGWQTKDIYQNVNVIYLYSIKINQQIDKNLFKLPRQD